MKTTKLRRILVRPVPIAKAFVVASACLALADEPKPVDRPEPAAAVVVPFDLLATNHMVLKATINGKGPYRLIFDVGSPLTLLSNKAAEASGVVKPSAPRSFLFGARGEAEVATLQIGELTAKKVPVLVMDHPTLKALGDVLGRPIDGLFGFTFFARYKTTIDYQARKMTFEPVDFKVRNLMADLTERIGGPKVARKRFLAPLGLWGITVDAPIGGLEAKGVPIKSVAKGSAAEAGGLKPGDVLTTLDGRWTTSVADVFAAASVAAAGKPVPITILREGRETLLTVTPRPGI